MKFGKSLGNQINEALPEWKDKFLSYKRLKKILNIIIQSANPVNSNKNNPTARSESVISTSQHLRFTRLLESELYKFNSFFLDKEEEFIIRLKEMQARVASAEDRNSEIIKIRADIVDFHGEMVLLESYSALNYLGLMKIVKKFDKRTGARILLPFIEKLLKQPFVTTNLINEFLRACESMLDQLRPLQHSDSVDFQDTLPVTDNLFLRGSVSALRVLRDVRSGSSTVNAFSLPPLQDNNGHHEEDV